VAQDLELTFEFEEVHVLLLRVGKNSGEELIRAHLEVSGQLLDALLGSGETLREEMLLPLDGILDDKKSFFWLRRADLYFSHGVLLSWSI
jgi:hypothetical protein